MTVDAAPSERSSLAVLWDVIVAPKAAFEALRQRVHWRLAFLIVSVLGVGGALLQLPASEHVVAATFAQSALHDPNLAGMSPEKQQQLINTTETVQRFSWMLLPIIVIVSILVTAAVLLLGNAIAKGTGTFARFMGVAANIAFINFGIAYLLIGILARLRGADAFNTQRDIITVIPSLAWLAPGASPKVIAFLAAFNPFEIWSFALIVMALRIVANVRGPVAYAVAAIVSFGPVIFTIPFAK